MDFNLLVAIALSIVSALLGTYGVIVRGKLKAIIEALTEVDKALEDNKITRDELDSIIKAILKIFK